MPQLALFDFPDPARPLKTFIERVGETLLIPEGIQTIQCTHGLHRFPGKFIPNLPRYLIRSVLKDRKNKILCDPFCGSGTTLIEASLEGWQFVGIDIDPLAVKIASAKLQPLSKDNLYLLERYWKDFDYEKQVHDFVPQVPNLSHWFSPKAVTELSAIKSGCLKLPDLLKLFSLIIFSSIIRRVSNADDQTQKTYVSHTLKKKAPLPSELFPIFLKRAINRMNEYSSLLPHPPVGQVIQGDARKSPQLVFDDVLTSPPYIDSIDYMYNQMLEYFWLLKELGIDGYDDFRSLRKIPMGFRSELPENNKIIEERFNSQNREIFINICSHIRKISRKEESVVRAFFQDFSVHCELFYNLQRQGSFYICIIGNSMLRRVTIPTVDLLIDIFQSVGYKIEDRMNYEIRRHYMKFPRRGNSGKIKYDYILVFRR